MFVILLSEHHLELHAMYYMPCMQALFQLDARNYNGQVFAGLACLQLGKHHESKSYYKGAIAQQPDGPLAWKVSALAIVKYRYQACYKSVYM